MQHGAICWSPKGKLLHFPNCLIVSLILLLRLHFLLTSSVLCHSHHNSVMVRAEYFQKPGIFPFLEGDGLNCLHFEYRGLSRKFLKNHQDTWWSLSLSLPPSCPPSLSFSNLTLASESSNNLCFDDVEQFTVPQHASSGAPTSEPCLMLGMSFFGLGHWKFLFKYKVQLRHPFLCNDFSDLHPHPQIFSHSHLFPLLYSLCL